MTSGITLLSTVTLELNNAIQFIAVGTERRNTRLLNKTWRPAQQREDLLICTRREHLADEGCVDMTFKLCPLLRRTA